MITSLLRGRGGWTAKALDADQATLRTWILDVFARLLADSVASRAAADQADLLGELLEWFADAARDDEGQRDENGPDSRVEKEGDDAGGSPGSSDDSTSARIAVCIGSCASHSLSARNFRAVFRCSRTPKRTAGPAPVAASALRAAARRDGPAAYFDFTGAGDGGGVITRSWAAAAAAAGRLKMGRVRWSSATLSRGRAGARVTRSRRGCAWNPSRRAETPVAWPCLR